MVALLPLLQFTEWRHREAHVYARGPGMHIRILKAYNEHVQAMILRLFVMTGSRWVLTVVLLF